MARPTSSSITQLLQQLSLPNLIRRQGISLRRHGDDWIGRCPFHGGRDPWLVVSSATNRWQCLGICQASGNAIDWVMRRDGVSYRHAIEQLRTTTDPDAPVLLLDPAMDDGTILIEVLNFYHHRLLCSHEAIAYLSARGLNHRAMIERFRLGYADRTLSYQLASGAGGRELRARLQGLGILRPSGHERLNGSLVIPVLDAAGAVANCYGRKLRDDLRPGTPYHTWLRPPSGGIWNVGALRGRDEVVLCKGLLDALTFWVAGFERVTSVNGTAGIGEELVRHLRTHRPRRVLLAYHEIEPVAQRLTAEGLCCYRVGFPTGMDPNRFVLAGEGELADQVREAEFLDIVPAVTGPRYPLVRRSGPKSRRGSKSRLVALIEQHLESLTSRQMSSSTIGSRRRDLRLFAEWCKPLSLVDPGEISLPLLERYRSRVHEVRKRDGAPLGWGARTHRLIAVKLFLRWAARLKHVPFDAGAALEVPRRPQQLPRAVLSATEAEQVLAMPRPQEPMGIRDRAILETLYSTGMRRMELIQLLVTDVDSTRGVVFIREGKGRRDRVVPIGRRAIGWIERYRQHVRPRLVLVADPGVLFLSSRGRAMRSNRLTEMVHRYLDESGIGKKGSCHIFRHTMATLMLEGGADVRYIQAMLGHAQLSTTALYTRVSITQLKAVHERSHPANQYDQGGLESGKETLKGQ